MPAATPAATPAARPADGRLRRWATSPLLLILFIAPFFGEGLSGSSPPFQLLLPWNLAFMAALYGCGALVCREVAHRFGLGFRGLIVLGVAYAVWEEALVDRYWFFPQFWEDSGIGDYSVVWHTNVLLATHLTAFHTTISICAAVLVVEWLVPGARHRPWVSRRGLVGAGIVLAVTPVIYGEFDQRPPVLVLLAAVGLLVLVVSVAFLTRPRRPSHLAPNGADPATTPRPPRRGVGLLAFGCITSHWFITYSVAESGIGWPWGVALALLPVVVGIALVTRLSTTGPYGRDGVRVVTGLLCFFVLLDLLIALLGGFDMILNALVAAVLAWWLRFRMRTASLTDMAGTEFEKAVESVGALAEDPGNDTKLRLYALYKQATVGDADGKRPGFTNPVGRAKYDAWAKLTGTSSDQAEADYVAEVARLT